MSGNGDMNDKKKLAALDELVIAEILATSDAEALAAVSEAEVAEVQARFAAAKIAVGKSRMAKAKAAVAIGRAQPRSLSAGSARGAASLRTLRANDRAFDQRLTMAARNGGADVEADREGIEEDLAELEAWEDDIRDGRE
jgi:hypothetical protein